MFVKNKSGERRLSPPGYRLLLTVHIIVSVGWLGVVFAKLVLGVVAVTTSAAAVAEALYLAMDVLNVAFPPLAISTIVSGVLLAVGTRWGLLKHYWVATKLVLAVGVIVTAVQLSDLLIQQSVSAPSAQVADTNAMLAIALAPTSLLISLSVTHLLMLTVAAIVSVYKPWGKTRWGRRKAMRMDHS